jgi:hypothetical protein
VHVPTFFYARKFCTFASKYIIMANFTLTPETWQKVKTKFLRKYRELATVEIAFTPGQEDQLVQQLAKLVNRDGAYIEFTIRKALADPDGNRL